MSIRAVSLGFLLGLFVAGATYFNDFVITQTFLIGNHLPASVFGVALILLLGVNPILRLMGAKAPLRGGELAVIVALGLAVCAWPGSGLLRYFVHYVALPSHMLSVRLAWQQHQVMSYTPGISPLLAPGFVADWPGLALRLRSAADDGDEPFLAHLTQHLGDPARQALQQAQTSFTPAQRKAILGGLNQFILAPDPGPIPPSIIGHLPLSEDLQDQLARLDKGELSPLDAQRLRRRLIDAALPALITPMPQGHGVLLNDGVVDGRAIEPLITSGISATRTATPLDIPWDIWWPTLRLWGGAVLFTGLAVLCVLVIVHPQWSQREVLPYPTVQFLDEMTRRREGGFLPDIAGNRLFWYGLGGVAVLHLINGLHAWFPDVPQIHRDLPFDPLRDLFPNASKVNYSWGLFHPFIYPSVIGFGFFINTRVSFSIGMAHVLWVALGAWMLSFATTLTGDKYMVGGNGPSLRFGAYVGMLLMILYFGRRYYAGVLAGAVGLRRVGGPPRHALWAARCFALFFALAVYTLVRWGGLDPLLSLLMVAMVVMIGVVLARINVETGLFYAQPDWLPGAILAGFFGVQGLGPSSLIVLLMASIIMAGDPREGIGPYLANGLRMTDRIAGISAARSAPWLGGMVVAGLAVALVATLTIQYNRGLSTDGWAQGQATETFNHAATSISKLAAYSELSQATGLSGLEHVSGARPVTNTLIWAGVGLVLVLALAVARLRLPWWPLHPVLFLVMGTYPVAMFAVSFLLAAAIKGAVIRLGGERSYVRAKPLMVGLIAGDVLLIIFWSMVGSVYYFATNKPPALYLILPK
ncbi:MAG: DUF6785 family protein [Phycisphaeraceae bacterium]